MRRILLLAIAFFVSLSSHAQYLNTSGSHYNPFTYEELARPLIEMQRAQNQAVNNINELYSYIADVLGHDIDDQLRQEMNSELKTLDTIAKQLSSNGISASINNSISASYRRVSKSIAEYNNRVAKYNKEQAAREEAERRKEAARKQEAARKAAEPKEWSGSGFAIKNGYIVTNYHVVDGAKSIKVYGINGSMSNGYDAQVVASDRINDLAIIHITDSRFSGFGTIPYAIKNQMVDVGEDVWVLGYPLTQVLGNEIKLTNGIVSSRSGYQGDVATYQISAPVQPGNSGGPLFDSRGNIVGIVNAGIPGAENIGYAIKTSYLKSLADSYGYSSLFPSSNTISSLALKEQVKRVRNYVFLIICSSQGVSYSATSGKSSSSTTSSTQSSSTSRIKRRIGGTVRSSNSNAIMIGVSVTNKRTNESTWTNSNGVYSIMAAEDDLLEFSCNNYKTLTKRVGSIQYINVTLSPKGESSSVSSSSRSSSTSTPTTTNTPRKWKIQGVVRSSKFNAIMIGVKVTIKGTNESTWTNSNGEYSIIAKEGDILEYSCSNHKTAYKTVGASQVINVEM